MKVFVQNPTVFLDQDQAIYTKTQKNDVNIPYKKTPKITNFYLNDKFWSTINTSRLNFSTIILENY